MLNCWIQWYLLAILSRFIIYISVNVLQKQSFQFFLFLPCLWFKTQSWRVFVVASNQSNHNRDLALVLVARESLWIPASMNGTFFMVSWRFWSTGTCFSGGVALKLAREVGILGSSNIPTELWYWVWVARYVESSRREWSEIVLADVMSAFNFRMALDHWTLLKRRS